MITVRGTIIPHSPWSVNYTILVSNNHYQSVCSIHIIFNIIVYQNEANNNNPDDSLNLDNLLIQLRTHITPKWYEFGTAIGVPEELLQQYSSYPADERLIEVLNYLLRHHQNPTWRDIAKLLHDTELHELAESIMNVYETGAFIIANCKTIIINDDVSYMQDICQLKLMQTTVIVMRIFFSHYLFHQTCCDYHLIIPVQFIILLC